MATERPSILLLCGLTIFALRAYSKLAGEEKRGQGPVGSFLWASPGRVTRYFDHISLASTGAWPPLTTRKNGNVFKDMLRKKEWVW